MKIVFKSSTILEKVWHHAKANPFINFCHLEKPFSPSQGAKENLQGQKSQLTYDTMFAKPYPSIER